MPLKCRQKESQVFANTAWPLAANTWRSAWNSTRGLCAGWGFPHPEAETSPCAAPERQIWTDAPRGSESQ